MRPDLVIRGIDLLCTLDRSRGGALGAIRRGAVALQGDRVAWVGPDVEAPDGDVVVDGSGCIGLPGLVDCHTHTVYAGSRGNEFAQRLAGATYSEIAESGGGILSTVRATREASDIRLVDLTVARLLSGLELGVTTVEIKSGYALQAEGELRLLKAAIKAGSRSGVRVLPTFLGAHAFPPEFATDHEAYVQNVIDVQIPLVAGVAHYIDVYVDRGAFSVEQGRRILAAGVAAGLKPRVHAEQIAHTGAAVMGASLGALSADHLERIDADGIAAMKAAGTVAVLLPGAMLYLRDSPPPVLALRAAGIPMAVATDLNPGSSPVADLWACATLACLTMGLTVDEAIAGITREAARALGRPDLGVLQPGSAADLVLVAPPPGEPCDPVVLIQHLGRKDVRFVARDGAIVIDRDGRDARIARDA